MNGLTIALYGLALLYAFAALRTVASIGKPKKSINTGGEAAFTVVFSALFIAVFVIAAQAVAS